MSGGVNYGDAEPRLSLQEVPEKISRIFFGDPNQGQPQYGSYDSYGAPSYNGQQTSYSSGSSYYNAYNYYQNFNADLELLMKLGHGALIVFIVLGVVAVIFLIVLSCVYCSGLVTRSGHAQDEYPQPLVAANHPGQDAASLARSVNGDRPKEPRREWDVDDSRLRRAAGADNLAQSLSDALASATSSSAADSSTTTSCSDHFERPTSTGRMTDPASPAATSRHPEHLKQQQQQQQQQQSQRRRRARSSEDREETGGASSIGKTKSGTALIGGTSSSSKHHQHLQQQQQRPEEVRGTRMQHTQSSDNSNTTDRSQERSMPYYEVPATNIMATYNQHHLPATFDPAEASPVSAKPPLPPPLSTPLMASPNVATMLAPPTILRQYPPYSGPDRQYRSQSRLV